MSLLGRFFLWRAKRRHLRRQRWLRDQKIVFTFTSPAPDTRNWQDKFMRSRKP